MALVNEGIVEKLRKVLALTNSPIEGEAQAAAEMLQKLLTAHNLSVADLEKRGQAKPGIRKGEHDLGKAAFTWKLDLAEAIADHYFCYPLVDRRTKSVAFIGRPENVESLQMLYAWVIDQIKRLSTSTRKEHIDTTHEHIDPLRWQVNFGIGAVDRLRGRLREKRQRESADNTVTTLVVSHRSEISDWTEEHFGYRTDGRPTKREKAWHAEEARMQQMKTDNPEEYYKQRPWETPEAQTAQEKRNEQWRKKEEQRAKRCTGRALREPKVDYEKEEQAWTARESGRDAGDKVNLEPFLDEHARKGQIK